MEEFSWKGLTSAYKAGKLITGKKPFSLLIGGDTAAALKKVAKPGIKLNREIMGIFLDNFSLTALPGLMVYALGRKYQLEYDNLGKDGVRINFKVGDKEIKPGKNVPV